MQVYGVGWRALRERVQRSLGMGVVPRWGCGAVARRMLLKVH